jgi:predicted dinucleotide-binding enzyme
MQIAIIGIGNVGAALGQRWAAAGHDILFGVRQPGAAKVAAVVKKAGARARAVAVREAAAGAAVAVLAVPFDAVPQAIAECGSLTGKIVIDCNNPLLPNLSGFTVGHTDSCGEMVARWAKGARVVKTLNTTGSGNMLDPRYGHEALSMFGRRLARTPSFARGIAVGAGQRRSKLPLSDAGKKGQLWPKRWDRSVEPGAT